MMENLPCIIGVAQKTYHPEEGDAPHPLLQAIAVSQQAASDCGNADILNCIDEVDAVRSISWHYDDLPGEIASALQLKPGERKLSGLSGTSPQKFLNEAAENILQGKRQAVLVCGAEAFATRKRAKKSERQLDWPKAQSKASHPFEDPFHPSEMAHEVFQAYSTFAVLDSARRAHLGIGLDENRRQHAEMMARFSEVAAENPYAWFPKAHSPESLFQLSDKDRMVSYPFSKNTMAFMDVDMASAIIITNHSVAEELNVPQQKRIYLNGWGYAKEPPYIAQRAELWQSPAMKAASEQAFNMAGKTVDDMKLIDIYSCFASNINFTKDCLGINDQDSRPLTMTGGLPYFGGPGNNYTAHAISTMVEQLRQKPGEYGMISGVGMHMTNHVFAIYSSTPSPINTSVVNTLDNQDIKDIAEEVNGLATVTGYTVVHSRYGNSALLVCDVDENTRCYARCQDETLLSQMEKEEWVGKKVNLKSENQVNTVISTV